MTDFCIDKFIKILTVCYVCVYIHDMLTYTVGTYTCGNESF